jgi:hypothetical protein
MQDPLSFKSFLEFVMQGLLLIILLLIVALWIMSICQKSKKEKKRWNDFTPPPMPPPPKKEPEIKINVSGMFRQIAAVEYDRKLFVNAMHIYRLRTRQMEKLLKQNNIPYDELEFTEVMRQAKTKIEF